MITVTRSITTALAPFDFSYGHAGIIAPNCGWGRNNSVTPNADNLAFFGRFVSSRAMTVDRITFVVSTAAAADDPISLAIYTGDGERLETSGIVTGQVDSTGIKTVNLAAPVHLNAGAIYYAALSYGVAGGTRAAFQTIDFNTTNNTRIFGENPPDVLAFDATAAHPLPATFPTVSGEQLAVYMAVLEA